MNILVSMEWKLKARIYKLLVICLGIGIIFFLGSLFLVSQLPGPTEINKIIKASKNEVKKKQTTFKSESIESNSDQLKQVNEDGLGATKEQTPEELITILLESKNELTVCENLQEKTIFDPKKKDGGIDFNKLFLTEHENDPILSTIKYPLIKVFQDEKLSSLFKDIFEIKVLDAQNDKQDSFLKKMGFYTKAAIVAVHLRGRKREFEKTADRAQHLRIFSLIANLKPDLAQDSDFLNLCESIQRSIIQEDKIDIKEERKNILSLIKKSDLTPKDLDFKPESFTHFKINSSKKGLTFNLADDEIDQEN